MGETVRVFASWVEKHEAAGSLMAEAAGWGERVDQGDDAAVLAWAREYLPRVLALQAVEVRP